MRCASEPKRSSMTPLPPRLSKAERAAANLAAIAARKKRAQAKESLRKGDLSIFDLINSVDPAIRKMRVRELLEAVPGVGKLRAEAIMDRANISSTRRIAGLGNNQISSLRGELSMSKIDPTRGTLIVMSGPGGVGKSTITRALRHDPRFWISISATTREPRIGEREGFDYYFYTDTKFDQAISDGAFLEWAEFAGARYGTPQEPIDKWLTLGKHVLLEIEIAGARQVRASDSTALLVFIAPPSWDELKSRLTARGTDSPARQAARLALAEEEMASSHEFDHILVNHSVNQVIEELVSLAASQGTPRQ
jgi:guanylate kinase